MKKIIIAVFALASLASCSKSLREEWQPVLGKPSLPKETRLYSDTDLPPGAPALSEFITIKALKEKYASKPLEISGNVWIKGKVVSSDHTGNVYREIYIQDETGGIDLKLGKSSLYSEYSLGQTLYVKCDELTLGAYNGMPQLGLEADNTSTNEYETSYIDLQVIIDEHVFKGQHGTPLAPEVVTPAQILDSKNAGYKGDLWGKYVKIENLTYSKQIFALFYPNPNLPHKSGNAENRVFLSDKGTWGVTTWACSKAGYIKYLQSGVWDSATVGSGGTTYGTIDVETPRHALGNPEDSKTLDSFHPDEDSTYKDIMIKYATANYISHYFKGNIVVGTVTTPIELVQVRTSGYAKFADEELPAAVRDGSSKVDITGIMTFYSSSSGDSAQITLVDEPAKSVTVK